MSLSTTEDQQGKPGGRGSVEASTGPRFLVIGRVLKPHGVRGEVRVSPQTDLPERFGWLKVAYLGDEEPQPVQVEGLRFHKSLVLLKLAGYDDRNAADSLRGMLIQVPLEDAIPLEEGEYFLYQLIGLTVRTDSGELLGELVEIIETGANNVFMVRGPQGEILLPDTEDVVTQIDFDSGLMVVHLLPGLLP